MVLKFYEPLGPIGLWACGDDPRQEADPLRIRARRHAGRRAQERGDDDGFILYESRAICRYLAEKYAEQGTPELIPTELKAKALFEQAASVEFANFEPLARGVYMQRIAKMCLIFFTDPSRKGLEVDQAALDKIISDLSTQPDIYEEILGKQKYLAGDMHPFLVISFHFAQVPHR
ncbi:hypothetical protein C8R44DRAFT_753480 [Mycena epipterygia]|nr:hypothetical protein C8R44DRAFT_753480 [Mycena epipterygia]